ncbi:unnamed protein product [Rhizophagus irregularis]|nr:unnamed protein product [Rhizophagus irregularis]
MTSSQTTGPIHTVNNTITDTTMEEATTSSSTHVLSHSEIEITSRDTQEIDLHTQTPITENLTFMDEDPIESNTDKDSIKAHKGFIPRDSFPSKLTNNEIINLIKTSFIKDSNAFRFDVNTTSTYRYFTIHFRTRDSLDQYIGKSPDSLKHVKIYELTNEAINTLIGQKFANLDQAVIKIMDIPYNYDTSMLIKHLAVKTAAYDYFMKENYWSLKIENFIVRILPGNPDDPKYKKRTSHYFKITGLPPKDIEPLIKHIYGRTCTFTQTTKHSTMKNAYIYVSPDNYPVNASNGTSLQFEGYNLHILLGYLSIKTCNTCGSPLHKTKDCDDKNFDLDHFDHKIFKKRFIKHNEEKITISDNHKTRYNHVITLNANKNPNTTSQNYKPTQPQPCNHNNKYPQTGSLLYPRQYKQITQLEQQVQSLLNNIRTLQEGKSKVDSTIADIHHNHNLMNTSIANITTRLDKYDTIIQHLTTNINLLSQEKIAHSKERSLKTPKRSSPYEQTSYRATKSKYNLRGNKYGNTTGEDSEQPLATDEDTEVPDDAVMSDGAVFEGIIDELSNTSTPTTEPTFSVKSYNPLNLLPQFNVSH